MFDGLDQLEQMLDFPAGQDVGQGLGLLRPRNPGDHLWPAERCRVEELDRGDIHMMGRRADLPFLHEIRQEFADLRGAKLRRRATIVSDEVLRATQVFLLRRLRKPPQVQIGLIFSRIAPMVFSSADQFAAPGETERSAHGYAPTLDGHASTKTRCRGSGLVQCMLSGAPDNSHGRRGLVYAVQVGDARAVEGLELYAKIFHVDAESKRLGESREQRFERRLRDTAPWVDELHLWVERCRGEVEPKTPFGQALRYLHRQWPRLTAFLRDPLMELTNNEVERDIRPWVLRRCPSIKECLHWPVRPASSRFQAHPRLP